MSDLLPCPFCSGEAEFRQNSMTGEMTMAECGQCGARAYSRKWNARVHVSHQAEIERLRKALEFYANPEIYKPHPHGPAFDRRDLSFHALSALATPSLHETVREGSEP